MASDYPNEKGRIGEATNPGPEYRNIAGNRYQVLRHTADGNCLFRAIAAQRGTQYTQVKEGIAKHLRETWHTYADWYGEDNKPIID